MISRRTMLRGGTAAVALTMGAASASAEPRHLVLDYRPSQPTGWPATPGHSLGTTLGGHTAAVDFRHNGVPHQVSTRALTYADAPTTTFQDVLTDAFGAYYAFHRQGFAGEFRVQSYGVFAEEGAQTRFGGGLYAVYQPGRGDPPARDTLGWIQVAAVIGDPSRPPEVDHFGRANPFYAFGGLTSINGDEVVNFHDISQAGVMGTANLDTQFLAETFLAHDTGRRTAEGKTIITIHGGMTWGWQVARR